MRALSIAATGMEAQQTNVEVISNNIANVSTTGFKRGMAEFEDLLYQDVTRVGTQSSEQGTILPTGMQLGLGVRSSGVTRVSTQGSLTETGNQLDVAINGEGYFGIKLPTGDIVYTRDGTFKESPTGQIVNNEGYPVMPGISVATNATAITINAAGQVIQTLASGKQTTVGQLQLFTFPNEAGLEAQGGNDLMQTDASGQPVPGAPGSPGFGSVQQGYVESSNVNVVQEMTNLISAQRAYEMNSKVIEAADQMMQTTNQIR
ncbi:flagellar basal-body rod protein FlgG [Rhodopila globiformis]|uniref:Flagellar basal-body rod protein FlgG n=1 Tax=Rhodopila globiformis TaxID=1071 RepID=A0A2S6MZ54_RHOGL|nr:flagellar basal-body rod protein FlgG [Rhodopila globiformis]PPQ27629.1 flagellar basal-body rod protein FlgG [Rhodopila globiformis]